MIYTLALTKRNLDKRDVACEPSELGLTNLRSKFELHEHHSHNALNDVIANTKLFMAQMSKANKNDETILKDVLL
tara:strand:- start:778 stop:1002 length:225 start_codon:yes stop_codon:yes gene_type:complete